jgi:hypothetical protein
MFTLSDIVNLASVMSLSNYIALVVLVALFHVCALALAFALALALAISLQTSLSFSCLLLFLFMFLFLCNIPSLTSTMTVDLNVTRLSEISQ